MNDVAADAGAAGVIIGWVQVVKGIIPESWSKWLPLVAIALGVVYTLVVNPSLEQPIAAQIGKGIMIGFTAAGAFTGIKRLANKTGRKK